MTIQQKLRSVFDVRGNSLEEPAQKRNHVVPDAVRNTLVVLLGEFCGTFMFLFMSFVGAQTALNNNPQQLGGNEVLAPQTLLYVASSFGTALAVNVWIFYRVSGGMFNPAVGDLRVASAVVEF